MMAIINRLFRDIYIVFLPAFVIEAGFKFFLTLVSRSVQFDMLHVIWIMLAAFFLIIYSMLDQYKLIFTRKEFFYYTTKYSVTSVLFLKLTLYILMNFVFYLLYAANLNIEILYKLLSITTFYIFNAAVLIIVKSIFSKKNAGNIYVLLTPILMIIIVVSFIYFFYDQMPHFMLGANSMYSAKQMYISIMPLTLFGELRDYNSVILGSILLNCFLGILGIILFLLCRKCKINL
ncbi:hypothetical protein [Pediococcus acidilactici]|uniref:hypothetical protein n=1 Tax=Pediococcus acidilactici TaxID=1254 RepID=UPI000FFE2160|nr:hypothetical protein [Pediococcus acidilactici]QAT20862.1 hypothetical protein EQZ51_05005 [Pediococcus acidilactici]